MAVLSISEIKDNYYDFIVVGSGPACFSFISNLNSNFKVLVIEGGFKDFNSISQSSYEGQVDPLGFRHAPLDQFRIRQLGGSSNCWGGACVPFDPYDFELTENNKPLWPISYKSLIPHYIKAGSLYGIGNYFSIKKPPVVFNRSIPGLRQSFWLVNDSKKNFTDRVLQLALNSSKIDLCLESNLVDVISTANNRISSIIVSSYNSESFTVPCNRLILCTGGFESTRLLLNWHRKHNIFSKIESTLGHFYSPHVNMYSGKLIVRPEAIANPRYVNLSSRITARAFFSLDFTPDFRDKYLNSKWTLEPEYNTLENLNDFKSFAYNLKTIDTAQDMIKNIVNRGDSPSNLRRYLSTSNKSASSFNLNVAFDQTPCFSSCISLSNQKTDLSS